MSMPGMQEKKMEELRLSLANWFLMARWSDLNGVTTTFSSDIKRWMTILRFGLPGATMFPDGLLMANAHSKCIELRSLYYLISSITLNITIEQ